jgi:hypothetical protein
MALENLRSEKDPRLWQASWQKSYFHTFIKIIFVTSTSAFVDRYNQRLHRVAMSLSGVHSIMMVKSWWGWGSARPPPFTLSTITSKVVVHVQAERADTLPLQYFLLYPYMYSVDINTWSQIHELTISLRFLGIILRVLTLRPWGFRIQCWRLQTSFKLLLLGGGGGGGSKKFFCW